MKINVILHMFYDEGEIIMFNKIIEKINKWFDEAAMEMNENPELVAERFVELEVMRNTI